MAGAAWRAPLGGRHDWVTNNVSVEVKTTGAATGPVVHRINRLDQLDHPGTGTLYLLSVRTVNDPSGTDSLDALLERTRHAAATLGTACTALLDDRLQQLDITQADRGRYSEPRRIAQAVLYRVDDDFPRLVPGSFARGLPAGVADIGYSLDTSACEPWLVARQPSDTHVLRELS